MRMGGETAAVRWYYCRVISFLRKWRLVREVWELSVLFKAITTRADLTGAPGTASTSTSSSTTRPAAWTGLWRMPCARGSWTWAGGSWGSTRGWATIWPILHKQVGRLCACMGKKYIQKKPPRDQSRSVPRVTKKWKIHARVYALMEAACPHCAWICAWCSG